MIQQAEEIVEFINERGEVTEGDTVKITILVCSHGAVKRVEAYHVRKDHDLTDGTRGVLGIYATDVCEHQH